MTIADKLALPLGNRILDEILKGRESFEIAIEVETPDERIVLKLWIGVTDAQISDENNE